MRPQENVRAPWQRLGAWLVAALGLTASAHLIVYAIVAAEGVAYPYLLEWMEGGTLDVMARVARGEPLYVAPTLEYVPYVYPPLYYWVAGAGGALVGVTPAVPRALSLLASCATLALLGRFAYRESLAWPHPEPDASRARTRAWAAAIAAAGLYLAAFELGGRWFHVARLDALYVSLLVSSAYALRFHPGVRGTLLASALGGLAVLTKQSALIALAPVFFVVACSDQARLRVIAAATAAGLGGLLALHVATDGWFSYFVWGLPLRHPWHAARALSMWTTHVAGGMPLGVIVSGAGAAFLWRGRRDAVPFHAALATGLLGSAWLASTHSGGYLNVLLPAFAALGLLTGLAVGAPAQDDRHGALQRHALTALTTVQLALLLYAPGRVGPTDSDAAIQGAIVARLAAIDGEVLVPGQRYLPTLAGKQSFGLEMAAADVLRASPGDWVAFQLRSDIDRAVASGRFDAVVLNHEGDAMSSLRARYRAAGRLVDDAGEPVTGAALRPTLLYLRAGAAGYQSAGAE